MDTRSDGADCLLDEGQLGAVASKAVVLPHRDVGRPDLGQLAQIVPVAGVVVSAGLNAALMRTIGETADHLYRERFLAERYGRVETSDGASTDLARSADSQELSADIARYVEIAEAESRP